MSELEKLRKKIDEIDEQIVTLFNERAKVVIGVGEIKRKDKNAPPIYAPDREQAVMAKIKRHNKGPLPDRTLMAIYREMMSGSFFLERPLRIAYLGPDGSFSHTAAMMKFGQSVEYEPQTDIRGVFDEINHERCDLGIVPIENSIAGGVIETLDELIETPVHICAELRMAIHHNLMANCRLEEITTVYSKLEVFTQCRQWLSSTLPNIATIPSASTAEAAHQASNEPGTAAIGSKLAAELYNLKIVCENIEDIRSNVTRFFVIGREPARPTGNDKTAIVFNTAHKVGALVDVLHSFQNNGVNLTNIESRPSRTREMEYYFFMECQGHQSNEDVLAALKDARGHCLQLSVLGSYPAVSEVL